MSHYITGFAVSTNPAEVQEHQSKGFIKIDANLKQDKAGNAVHLWFKKNKKQDAVPPVTRVQFSFNDEMCRGLSDAGYCMFPIPIPTAEGPVYLWFFCGTTPYDIPIVDVGLSKNPEEKAEKMSQDWEKVGCNLSFFYGWSWYLWVKREKPTYICDVTATSFYDQDADLFKAGYIRIDETTNTIFSGFKSTNFLWYCLTTDAASAITDLRLSTNPEEYQQYHELEYTLVDVNLNNGTGGRTVFMWSKKKEGQPPVKNMLLFHFKFAIPAFKKPGICVIEKNINEGNCGAERYLCFLKKQ